MDDLTAGVQGTGGDQGQAPPGEGSEGTAPDPVAVEAALAERERQIAKRERELQVGFEEVGTRKRELEDAAARYAPPPTQSQLPEGYAPEDIEVVKRISREEAAAALEDHPDIVAAREEREATISREWTTFITEQREAGLTEEQVRDFAQKALRGRSRNVEEFREGLGAAKLMIRGFVAENPEQIAAQKLAELTRDGAVVTHVGAKKAPAAPPSDEDLAAMDPEAYAKAQGIGRHRQR